MSCLGFGRFAFLLWLSVLAGIKPLAAQEPVRFAERYIERVFGAQIGEVPKMGWFAPSYGFVASEDVPNVTIYSPLGMPSAGRKKRSMLGAEIGTGCAREVVLLLDPPTLQSDNWITEPGSDRSSCK